MKRGIPVEWYQYDPSELMAENLAILSSVLAVGDMDVLSVEVPSSLGGEGILLTEPVSYAGITLAVNTEDANIQNLSDVSGDVYVGQEWFVRETIEAANSNIVMLPFQSYVPDFLEGFKEDGLPFALLDIEGWYLLKKNENLDIRLLEPVEYVDGCYQVLDENVQRAVDTFLQNIKEDGTLKEISEKWFGEDVSVERK